MQSVIRTILYLNGLAAAFDQSSDFHLRLIHEPWVPLVIERHGDEVSVTHYVEQNGDLLRDPEMIFSIAEWERSSNGKFGGWIPKSIEPGGLGRVYPTGEIVHRGDLPAQLLYSAHHLQAALSFARLWACNLRQQGFCQRYAADHIHSLTHLEALQAALAQKSVSVPIKHHCAKAPESAELHFYDIPDDLPSLLRRAARRQALAALQRDFPQAKGQYRIARRRLGYVLTVPQARFDVPP